jgi:hypothetical protein
MTVGHAWMPNGHLTDDERDELQRRLESALEDEHANLIDQEAKGWIGGGCESRRRRSTTWWWASTWNGCSSRVNSAVPPWETSGPDRYRIWVTDTGTQVRRSGGLTRVEIVRIVHRYIGVHDGYLGDFTYQSHCDFYPDYCDLDINPFDYLEEGTTRERFIGVLEQSPPDVQAKIIRGVIEKYPVGSSMARTEPLHDNLLATVERLERLGVVGGPPPTYTSGVVIRAIDDVDTLLQRGGPTSAVDRVHTALHGHLRYLCGEAGISFERDDTMVVLLKKLMQRHPKLQDMGPRNAGQSALGRHSKSSQPPPPESASLTGRHHPPRMTLSSGMSLDRGGFCAELAATYTR